MRASWKKMLKEEEKKAKSKINKRPHPDLPSWDTNKGFYEFDMNYPPWPFTADLLELISYSLPFPQPRGRNWAWGNKGAPYTKLFHAYWDTQKQPVMLLFHNRKISCFPSSWFLQLEKSITTQWTIAIQCQAQLARPTWLSYPSRSSREASG